MRQLSVVGACLTLMACSKGPAYNPTDFINPNKVVEKPANIPTPQVAATFGVGNDPSVVRAYNKYAANGSLTNIRSVGFETFAYDARSRPIIDCAPLHLCVVQLEVGENINDIQLGDSAHWMVSTSLVGTSAQGSYQVAVKPKLLNVATDMVITTTKRTYNIGLVSQQGSSTHVANFYYPEDTLAQAINHAKSLDDNSRDSLSDVTAVNVSQINFNYVLDGNVAWRPVRVFDDGDKTYIQMQPLAERLDLPVLYIKREKEMQLVNYRYKQPYYIVDGLFKTALLISGKGRSQNSVAIENKNFN